MIKEHYDILQKYDAKFEKALHGNYCRFTPSEFDEVAIVYKAMYGVNVTQADRNCSTCKLRILRKLGGALAEAKKQYGAMKIAQPLNKATEAIESARQSIAQVSEATADMAAVAAKVKANRGRKKKTKQPE